MAPSLVQAYQRYNDRDVVFLSLTDCDRASCEQFVREKQIPWPSGYGAVESVQALVDGNPTVLVVGRDGRICWNDRGSRLGHRLRVLPTQLDAAIDAALAGAHGSEFESADLGG